MSLRQRTIEWHDPIETAGLGRGLSGPEYLEKIRSGAVPPPPIGVTLGFRLAEIGEGFAVFDMKPEEFHYNPLATVHGGVICTLLDSAMSCAVHTLLPKGRGYTTAELKINFVRPITRETPLVRAEGRVIHPGRQLATSEGKLLDAQGRLYAHGVATCLMFDLPEKS
jgi:uncharacterized protein (TIGR00369 family)